MFDSSSGIPLTLPKMFIKMKVRVILIFRGYTRNLTNCIYTQAHADEPLKFRTFFSLDQTPRLIKTSILSIRQCIDIFMCVCLLIPRISSSSVDPYTRPCRLATVEYILQQKVFRLSPANLSFRYTWLLSWFHSFNDNIRTSINAILAYFWISKRISIQISLYKRAPKCAYR